MSDINLSLPTCTYLFHRPEVLFINQATVIEIDAIGLMLDVFVKRFIMLNMEWMITVVHFYDDVALTRELHR